jgi:hypothetical protein
MLYGDPTVRFGSSVVGGIRVSHVSHIDKPVTASLTETRGKRKSHTVEPLPDVVPGPSEADVAASQDRDELRSWWGAYPNLRDVIKARVDELDGGA